MAAIFKEQSQLRALDKNGTIFCVVPALPGGWVFGAGKCRGIAIWVLANAGHAGLRKHF